MVKPLNPRDKNRPAFFVGVRLFFITVISGLLFSFVFYGLSGLVNGAEGIAASITVLFGIPYLVGAWSVFLLDFKMEKDRNFYFWVPSLVLLVTLTLGALILQEGIVCLFMLAPLWLISSLTGAGTVRLLRGAFKNRSRSTLSCSVLILIPLLTLSFDGTLPTTTQYRQVSRDILIDAPIASVWPRLHQVENIQKSEGRWNFTQDILDLPRPKSAIFQGQGVGAVRISQWAEAISFEEHITREVAPVALEWNFAFPNDSLQARTDEHISPDGEVLKIQNGGYHLSPIDANTTRLTLYTDYQMTVPFGAYSALWGELILGDIQNNILSVIKGRTER